MFVLEDNASGAMQGCCAIEAACGLDEPFYNYHVGLTVQASPALDVYKRLPTLYLSNRSEEHTSELQSLMRISYAVFCLKKKKKKTQHYNKIIKKTNYTRNQIHHNHHRHTY